jgi:transcriptional regulator with XRE-family HTH domain
MNSFKIGEKIYQIRQCLGLTQRQLAEAVGVSHQLISSYEKGDSLPSLEVAVKIARHSDISLTWLTMDEKTPNKKTSESITAEERKILEMYRLAAKTDKDTVKRVLEMAAVASGQRRLCKK